MSSLLSGINARFRGAGRTGRSPGPGPEGPSQPPSAPPPPGPATTASSSIDGPVSSWPRPLPAWLNRASAKHIVKGNFMTLSARPKTVEPGEWIAHQVVEHYRVLWNFVRVIHEKDDDGKTICNRTTCPKMSAGKNHSYTWLNKNHEAVELPAYEYITLMQRWIAGKVDDINVFPTDPAGVSYAAESAPAEDDWVGRRSGFPKEFLGICRTIFLQMFRVYAHLFWDHFIEPFYHLNLEKSLNSCFSHFILTATTLDLLKLEDIEPMKPLIDLWAADGTFPPESKAYTYADVEQGKELMELSPAA